MAQAAKSKTVKNTSSTKILKNVVLAGFGIAAILLAYLTFIAVRDFVTSWEMTSLPGIALKDAPAPDLVGTPGIDIKAPLQPAGYPTPIPWDGAKRVSMLVMGLDYRDWESGEGPPRTDTMILLTVDPVARTAGVLSIPRDLWVNIPGGFNYGRINTAYQLGEAYQLPGGGPQLALDTVEELLGIPIDYYAQIDFGAFVKFIDEIGGIEVEVTENIKVDPLGDGNTKKLKPGKYDFNGDMALAYVRYRKSEGGDFDRALRQQAVIMSLRSKLRSPKSLQALMTKAPILYQELSSGIHTNLSLDQAIRLAWLASQIEKENIKLGSIGTDQITFAMSPDGTQQVLKPLSEKIRLLRDEVITGTGSISPAAANMDPTERMKAEGARVRVLNGSTATALGARTTDYLKSLGVNVTETGNAEQATPYTTITFYTGKPYTVKYLMDLFKVEAFRIRHFNDPASPVDVVVTVGEDWGQNNPMP